MEKQSSSDSPEEPIVHVREALMCAGGAAGITNLRTAYFLNHTVTAIDDPIFELPPNAFCSDQIDSKKIPLKLSFPGWRSPSSEWIDWVNTMCESYGDLWRKAGIYEAVLASRYEIKKHEDLVVDLVKRWSKQTNTFAFLWGETTITLEDLMILGGFSVSGNCILNSLKKEEQKFVEEKLLKARKKIGTKKFNDNLWTKEFMKKGSEIEHEAFLVMWLSRFVFPGDQENIFPVAVQLARGTRIALAPAVLAKIYKDLGFLKDFLQSDQTDMDDDDDVALTISSLFQFVQIWAWERFAELQPKPNRLNPGEPRLAQWHQKHLESKFETFRSVLDISRESFDWRPYSKPLDNYRTPMFYPENEKCVAIDSSLDEETASFLRCLRVANLVGFDCIQSYYPHRVAMQFGFDQDLPGLVRGQVDTSETAWKDYIRPISERNFVIPSRSNVTDATFRYSEWWKQIVSNMKSAQRKETSTKTTTRKPTRTFKATKTRFSKKVPDSGAGPKEWDGSKGSSNSRPGVKVYKETSKSSRGKHDANVPILPNPPAKVSRARQEITNPKTNAETRGTTPQNEGRKQAKKHPISKGKKIGKDQSAESNTTVKAITTPDYIVEAAKVIEPLKGIQLHQAVSLSQQGGEEGNDIVYQMPKSQFDSIIQDFQRVLTELQELKSTLNAN